jgi:hypothetical protein
MSVCLVWLGDPRKTAAVMGERGPWREVIEVAPGLLLVDSDETLSGVYHAVKHAIPQDCALLAAPVSARPKARGIAGGAVTWLRGRLPLPGDA